MNGPFPEFQYFVTTAQSGYFRIADDPLGVNERNRDISPVIFPSPR
jgi:hypothetical protein